EMLHQDLRPENVMIDSSGTVKIIDFGSTHVAGLADWAPGGEQAVLGTLGYTAPEYFLGGAGSERSDQFSLGVLTYHMLTGRLPYGTRVAGIRTSAELKQLVYASAMDERRQIPAWIDGVLMRAVHPLPHKRYEALSEFVHDLRHPNRAFLARTRVPLAERHPVRFWKGVSLLLAVAVIVLLGLLQAKARAAATATPPSQPPHTIDKPSA
ncbi:MAG: serine/threonine protein kinase, partial [Burkholderiales bacterium]